MLEENKHSPLRIVGIVVIFILAILIVLTFVIFGIFKDANSAPKLFGYRVYVVDNDRMAPRIPDGAAVFVEEGALPEPNSQSVILCRIDNQLWVIGYVGTEISETGDVRYLVKYDNATDDKTWGISQNDIIGVAKTYDKFFGGVIRFASSKAGMLIVVIIPCLLIIIYEVAMLVIVPAMRRAGRKKSSRSRSSESKTRSHREHRETVEPVIRRVGGGPDDEDIPHEKQDIHAPIDAVKEERYVEKQLRKANDRLSTTVLETTGVIEAPEINFEPISFEADKPKAPAAEEKTPAFTVDFDEKPSAPKFSTEEPKPEPKPEPIPETKPKASEEQAAAKSPLGDLSASRIDELIKLLEEEKKRLGE